MIPSRLSPSLVVFVVLVAGTVVKVAGVDQTMISQAYGADVVQAAIRKIQDTCIFANDFQFMRRVAWVETKFGGDLVSSWKTVVGQGGIWQLDPIGLIDTQNRLPQTIRKSLIAALGIDVAALSRDRFDLEVPMKAAVATRSYLYLVPTPIPMNLTDQASYWVTKYNKGGAVTPEKFLSDEAAMPSVCKAAGADLLFIVDSPGSIGSSTFNSVRQFLVSVVSRLEIGEESFKVAVDDFAATVTSWVKFNGSINRDDLVSQINQLPYYGYGTYMGEALVHALNFSFSPAQGVRKPSLGFPRIAVLITDGQPDGNVDAGQAAMALAAAGIELFTVGVGSGINNDLLKYMAAEPKCMHQYTLDSYGALAADFPEEIRARACASVAEAPATGQLANTIAQNQSLYFRFNVDPAAGMTFKLGMVSGSCVLFVSRAVRNPSVAENDFSVTASRSGPLGQIFISPADLRVSEAPGTLRLSTNNSSLNATATLYGSVEGLDASNNFTLTYEAGDTQSASPRLAAALWILVLGAAVSWRAAA